MILETKVNNEFHSNGQLAYTETIAILAPETSNLYPNRRIHPSGYEWIRIGEHKKYFDNGQLAWQLNYGEKGNVLKDDCRNYRKDGTVITH
jgi:hypothetical protein